MKPRRRWLFPLALIAALASPWATASADTNVRTSNESKDTSTESGNASSNNSSSGFVGHNSGDTTVQSQDVNNVTGTNVQEGDNDLEISQISNVSTGDAIGGQVAGAVGSGDITINGSNLTEGADVVTGDATGTNSLATYVGLAVGTDLLITADITNVTATNVQEGDNTARFAQVTDAASGDGIAGQILGAQSDGGSVGVTAANESRDVDITTGDATATNDIAAFIGLHMATGTLTLTSDVATATAENLQEGDNDFEVSQIAHAQTGDGIGGQVLGATAQGDVEIDATNTSADIDADTGDGQAINDVAGVVGLGVSDTTTITSDVTNATSTNVILGDNDGVVSQLAEAGSGDAVAGQVTGATAQLGSLVDIALDNLSEQIELTSGSATFANLDSLFIGLTVSTNLTVT